MFKNFGENEKENADARKLLEAKILDKYRLATTRNKITNTDFLNGAEKMIAQKILQENGIKNFVFFGGNGEESERNILIFYPEKLDETMLEKNYGKIVKCVRIVSPKNVEYEHRTILSGIMKLGLKREKIGDILVRENGADIIVLSEMAEFLQGNLRRTYTI